MSSIVTAVFEATIGLLVNKVRDKVAEKLKDGDVTDQKFRELIVRDIHDIKSKLDGISRTNLLASISFFNEGIQLLCEVFDKARSRSENDTFATQAACSEAFSLAKAVRKLDLTVLDEPGTRMFSEAKERFKKAREKATEAFSNETLVTSDRILAMQYRVMATILEKVDNPADALGTCRVCIEELHRLPAIQESFKVELARGLWGRFGKDERRKIISNVCHVNSVIYDVTLMVCFGNKKLPNLPCIGSGEDKVDPLRDERVTEALRKQGMEHCCVTWSFGQEGEEEHKLKEPWGIATNSSGQFIVGDYWDSNVKVFDSTGTFLKILSLPNDDVDTKLYVLDVATDINDNIYVLVKLKKPGAKGYEWAVYEFNNTADLHRKSAVRGDWGWFRLTVTDSGKVLVLRRGEVVDVYDTDGQFVFSFGENISKCTWDITAANDGRVMVVDEDDSCVHIFSEHGDHLNKFKLQGCYATPSIAFHRTSEHVVVANAEEEKDLLHVEIYTKDGEFVRSTQISLRRRPTNPPRRTIPEFRFKSGCNYTRRVGYFSLTGMTVTTEGRIAVLCWYGDLPSKVLVL